MDRFFSYSYPQDRIQAGGPDGGIEAKENPDGDRDGGSTAHGDPWPERLRTDIDRVRVPTRMSDERLSEEIEKLVY